MSVRDTKLDELIEVLCFDEGLARVARKAQADTPVDEIQKMIDEARANRAKLAQLFESAPLEIKSELARLRASCGA